MADTHPYRDGLLDEARARQRRNLRAIPDDLLARWRPPSSDVSPPTGSDARSVEIALRRAADDVTPPLAPFLAGLTDLAYAQTATASIESRQPEVSFQQFLATLAQTRIRALDELARIRLQDGAGGRWVHLVVWADELAEDGYHDPRLT